MKPPRIPLAQRLERGCERLPWSGCWIWMGSAWSNGYGNIRVGYRSGNTYRMRNVHRVAWELWRGPIPSGMLVLHKCDVMLCFNPEHLFLGTHVDNTQDMIAKGRDRFQLSKNPELARQLRFSQLQRG